MQQSIKQLRALKWSHHLDCVRNKLLCILKLPCKHHNDGTLHYAWVKTTMQWYLLPGFGKFIYIYIYIYIYIKWELFPNGSIYPTMPYLLKTLQLVCREVNSRWFYHKSFYMPGSTVIFFASLRFFTCCYPATILFTQRICELRKSWKDPMPFWLSLELLIYGNLIVADELYLLKLY